MGRNKSHIVVNGSRIDGIGHRPDRDEYWVYVNGKRHYVKTQKQALAMKLQTELKDYFDTNEQLIEKLELNQKQVSTSNVKLSVLSKEWEIYKGKQNRRTEYTKEQRKMYKRFLDIVGDKPTDALTRADIVTFNDYLLSAKISAHQKYRIVKSVRTILPWAVTYTNHTMPPNITDWLKMLNYPAPPADRKNKVPLPAAVFQRTIEYMRTYLSTEPPTEKTALSIYLMRCRLYKQQIAMYYLAANCSLDNADCTRIQWSDTHLLDKVPYISFSRRKMGWKVGAAIPRITPLAPQTVQALIEWQKETTGEGLVFTNHRRGQWDYYDISLNFKKIMKAIGEKYTFKSLRNIAPTLRRKSLLPPEMSELILGHTAKEERKRYEGDVPPTVLLPLVELVEKEYFR